MAIFSVILQSYIYSFCIIFYVCAAQISDYPDQNEQEYSFPECSVPWPHVSLFDHNSLIVF